MASVVQLKIKPDPKQRRAHLSNELIERLHLGSGERIYDDAVPGFYLQGGKRGAAFRVMADPPKRARVNLGLPKTMERTIGRWPEMSAAKARAEAQRFVGMIKAGIDPSEPEREIEGPTLQAAFDRFIAALEKKVAAGDRQPSTIDFYKKAFGRLDKKLTRLPLAALGTRRDRVVHTHEEISRTSGKTAADHTLVTLRATYNHARRTWPNLPENPVAAVDFNGIPNRSEDGMGLEDLKTWWVEVRKLRNPIKQQLLLFMLLTGLRSSEARMAARKDFDENEKVLHIPRPKGGVRRAFDLPLSDAAVQCIRDARTVWEAIHPPSIWLFPSGHTDKGYFRSPRVDQHRNRRSLASGHKLRHSFATAAEACGFVEETYGPLLNHKPKSVTGRYPNRRKNNALYRTVANDIGRAIMEAINE